MRNAHHSERYGFTILSQFKVGAAITPENGL